MITPDTMSPLDQLRLRLRQLELDACAVAAQVNEVRAMIAMLEAQAGPPRRGRPPRLSMHVGGAAWRPDEPGDAA